MLFVSQKGRNAGPTPCTLCKLLASIQAEAVLVWALQLGFVRVVC